MLTAAQREIRATGIGASEVAALVGMSPYRAAIDIWLDKTGRATGSNDNAETGIGHHLEAFALSLYTKRTGHKLFRPKLTLRHPEHPHVLASPDALGRHDDLGAEAKIVGSRMAHHWANDTLPDYVRVQALQNMAVTGRARWDVVALIGGTDLRVHVVERDEATQGMLCEAVESFWADHVQADVPPPVEAPEERRRYLLTRYPGSEAQRCRVMNDPIIAAAAERLRAIKQEVAELDEEELELQDALAEIIGDDRGIEGTWGKALWYPRAGAVSWKDVAEDLAGGAVPPGVLEKHRGEKTRVFSLYDPKVPKLLKGRRR